MPVRHGDACYPYDRYVREHPDRAAWHGGDCNSGIGALNQIVEIIETASPDPLTIGVFGGWGTGKTSLLRGVQSYFEQKGHHVVFFEAWRYSNEKIPPVVPLVQEMRRSIKNDSIRRSLKNVANKLLRLAFATASAFSVNIAGVTADFDKTLKSISESEAEDVLDAVVEIDRISDIMRRVINKLAPENGQKVILLIDDVDRVTPDKAWQMLEAIRFFFRLEKSVVVLGLDDQVISRVIDKQYEKIVAGENFLSKIVQVEVELPRVPFRAFGDDEESLLRVLDERGKEAAGCLPPLSYRTWNRITNKYMMTKKKYAEADAAALYYLAFLSECFPEIGRSLRADPEALTEAFCLGFPTFKGSRQTFEALADTDFSPLFLLRENSYFGEAEAGKKALGRAWAKLMA